ncbi:MAG: hypothetical protein ACD_75C00920G0001 [uncultured bacterium]|nr:MAG: hypothetical protein ACD_75C00920G0001 [uncultured bacterium]
MEIFKGLKISLKALADRAITTELFSPLRNQLRPFGAELDGSLKVDSCNARCHLTQGFRPLDIIPNSVPVGLTILPVDAQEPLGTDCGLFDELLFLSQGHGLFKHGKDFRILEGMSRADDGGKGLAYLAATKPAG